jgi:hypothetical protein
MQKRIYQRRDKNDQMCPLSRTKITKEALNPNRRRSSRRKELR